MRLRRRLSVLVAIALVPSLVLTAYNAARWRIFLESESRATALSQARLAVGELDQIVDNARQLMTAMAKYPLNADNKADCAAYFSSINSDAGTFRQAAIIDTDGKFLCSTDPAQDALDVGGRIRFYQSLKTGTLSVATLVTPAHATSVQISMPYKAAALGIPSSTNAPHSHSLRCLRLGSSHGSSSFCLQVAVQQL